MRVSETGYPHVPFTCAKIRNAKPTDKPVKLTNGTGLYLEVRPTGTQLWRSRYRIAGSENVYAIEEYGDIAPKMGLAKARKSGLAAVLHDEHDVESLT
jgi:hypothetical protein